MNSDGVRKRAWSGFGWWIAAAWLACAPRAGAQAPGPHIGYVYPAGGRQGSTCEIAVGGQALTGVTNAWVSGTGVKVEVIGYRRPMTQKEFQNLRERLQELQKRTEKDEETRKEMASIREQIRRNPPNRQGNPAIAETATLRVTLLPDAEPGERELRLGTPAGLSNPMIFWVGQLPEFAFIPASERTPEGQAARPKANRPAGPAAAKEAMEVTLPATLNGQIMPGGVDRFRFPARKGERLVVVARARALIPYLSDAVPGWFQATLALYDAHGKEVAYADDYRFNPDPVLSAEVPADGEYLLEIRDSIYRGREDFIYRLTVGQLPFVTSVFPLGGTVGTRPQVELSGWNLLQTNVNVDYAYKDRGVYPVSVKVGDQLSNEVPFAIDSLPEALEQEPNDESTKAQQVVLPAIVNGRIGQPGDRDVFAFDGRAGEVIVAEVYARRLNSPLDSVLTLLDPAGQTLARNDDYEDKGSGLNTHHADSYLRVALPTNGIYRIALADAQRAGGRDYAYRLRVGPARPDFDLRIVPSTLNVRPGASAPLTVYALRKDGFTNAIELAWSDAPAGYTLGGARIPAGQDQVRFTLTAPATSTRNPATLALSGRAVAGGRELRHTAVPADDMMQAFAYHHLVRAKEWKAWLTTQGPAGPGIRLLSSAPVRIPAGGEATVRFGAGRGALANRFDFELSEPPEGVSLGAATPGKGVVDLAIRCDATKVKPGLQGNLIVQVYPAASGTNAAKARPQANRRRVPLATLPAIPFETVRQ